VDLDILCDDAHFLAINKPAGVVVHPTYTQTSGTLLDAVRSYAVDWPASHNPTLVGRLDKLTSGIVVVAKHAAAHAALQRTPMDKDYLAVVVGEVDVARGEIDLRLRVDPADRRRVVASPTSGRASLTQFERLAWRNGLALLRCRLITGRRHQIRAHLAAHGWPVVGDPVYGSMSPAGSLSAELADTIRAFPRQALHAWRVAFAHPASGDPITLEAAAPEDLRDLIAACGFRDGACERH
jgi:23S rRNA pseudouridine1911/1915/1917 synthase